MTNATPATLHTRRTYPAAPKRVYAANGQNLDRLGALLARNVEGDPGAPSLHELPVANARGTPRP